MSASTIEKKDAAMMEKDERINKLQIEKEIMDKMILNKDSIIKECKEKNKEIQKEMVEKNEEHSKNLSISKEEELLEKESKTVELSALTNDLKSELKTLSEHETDGNYERNKAVEKKQKWKEDDTSNEIKS